jgi:putative ABC transport system substrate-binding protein
VWPVVARAEQAKVWRVGYLTPSSSADQFNVAVIDIFRTKLRELGYVEGTTLTLYVRRAEGDYARLPALADELVALAPDVIRARRSGERMKKIASIPPGDLFYFSVRDGRE